ncbi:MAG: hypothetical protein J07HX64_02212 [halophilic archaeon J07HX64]|nr:MAG: hypothetical protein J07HX64_02212 [halophilic archaeon J07HX64]
MTRIDEAFRRNRVDVVDEVAHPE